MTPLPLHLAIVLVRVWTRIYTWRLPHGIRESRRAEIESDLWESRHDRAAGVAVAFQVIARLLFGMPDDLAWRVAHRGRFDTLMGTVAATIVVVTALFLVDLARARRLPVPPPPAASLLRPVTPVQTP